MEKILVVLIIILVVMIALLVFITIRNKKKNVVDIEEDFFDKDTSKIDDDLGEDINDGSEEEFEEKNVQEEILDDSFIEFESNFKNESQEEIEKIDIENEVTQIIDLMQVNSKNLIDKVSVYEDEQEENAIISYTELLNAVKSKKEVQEELKFDEYKEPVKQNSYQDEKLNSHQESKKFKSSEAISPLGRINKSNSEESYKSDIKNTNMYKDTNNTDDDFLKSLRDFREKL